MLRTHLKRGTEKWLHLTNLRCRSKSAAGKQCWKCSSSDINNTFFCASCGVLRESAEKEVTNFLKTILMNQIVWIYY